MTVSFEWILRRNTELIFRPFLKIEAGNCYYSLRPSSFLLKDMTQAGTTAPLAAALQNFQNIFKIK
jgi:hypothetical protein